MQDTGYYLYRQQAKNWNKQVKNNVRQETNGNHIFILCLLNFLLSHLVEMIKKNGAWTLWGHVEMRRETEQWCCRLCHLREHDQRDQRCHEEQDASTCAAGAVAEVTLTAAQFCSNDSWNLFISHIWAQMRGGTALHGHLLVVYFHWKNENNVNVLIQLLESLNIPLSRGNVWNRVRCLML